MAKWSKPFNAGNETLHTYYSGSHRMATIYVYNGKVRGTFISPGLAVSNDFTGGSLESGKLIIERWFKDWLESAGLQEKHHD